MEEKEFGENGNMNETEFNAQAPQEGAVNDAPEMAATAKEAVSADEPAKETTASAENVTAAPAKDTLREASTEEAAPAAQEIPTVETAPAADFEQPKDPDDTLSLDEMPQEETEAVTEEDIFGDGSENSSEQASSNYTEPQNTESTYSNGSYSTGSTYSTDSYSTGSTYNGNSYGSQNTYDGNNSYGNAGSYGYGASAYQQASHKHPGYITKKAFVIILIIAMLLTMLTSVGITTAYTTYLNSKTNANGHATNYTLTTSDESLSYKSIIEKTQDSVVSITTESVTNDMWLQNYVTQGAGSGVIIQSDGYIITCEHVIEGARKIKVTLRDGKEYDAEIIGADASNDIAVIKIDAKNLQEATYGDSSKLEVGDQVVAIGNPLGTLSGTATTGIISALNRNLTIDNRTLNLLQTDASINPGNSGGGMFDASGNLIGIVEAKSTGSDIDGLGFATPINKAAKIAKEIIKKGGNVSSGNGNSKSSNNSVIIGIMVAPVSESDAREYGYSHGGLLIRSVNSQEATQAGLQVGDIIFKADGKDISTNDDLSKVLSKKKEGDIVKLTIARQNGLDSEIQTKLISSNSTH